MVNEWKIGHIYKCCETWGEFQKNKRYVLLSESEALTVSNDWDHWIFTFRCVSDNQIVSDINVPTKMFSEENGAIEKHDPRTHRTKKGKKTASHRTR